MSTSFGNFDVEEVRPLPISSIRRDGQTQHRSAVDPGIVAEYAELMRSGIVFPPVRVWWDGESFWLSDGFQRVAAAEKAAFTEVLAEICRGGLNEAKWDSYAANASHGLRRTAGETKRVVRLALEHPNAAQASNVELARHLNIPEATLRRWRRKLSSSLDEGIRMVRRGETTYPISTGRIGKTAAPTHAKSWGHLHADVQLMKEKGSPRACLLLSIIDNWVFGRDTPSECLEAIEQVLRDEVERSL